VFQTSLSNGRPAPPLRRELYESSTIASPLIIGNPGPVQRAWMLNVMRPVRAACPIVGCGPGNPFTLATARPLRSSQSHAPIVRVGTSPRAKARRISHEYCQVRLLLWALTRSLPTRWSSIIQELPTSTSENLNCRHSGEKYVLPILGI